MHVPTIAQYLKQAEELKSLAKGFEIPVFNTLIEVLRQASSDKTLLAKLHKLGDESSRINATRKFALAAQAIAANKKLDAQSMQMK